MKIAGKDEEDYRHVLGSENMQSHSETTVGMRGERK